MVKLGGAVNYCFTMWSLSIAINYDYYISLLYMPILTPVLLTIAAKINDWVWFTIAVLKTL